MIQGRLMRSEVKEELCMGGRTFSVPGVRVWQLRLKSHYPRWRRTHILLVTPPTGPANAEDLCRIGWPTFGHENAGCLIPHFAVDSDGTVVQCLDPANEGSGCFGRTVPPTECKPGTAFTVAYIGSEESATKAALRSAEAIVRVLQSCCGPHLPILADVVWAHPPERDCSAKPEPAPAPAPKTRSKRRKSHA